MIKLTNSEPLDVQPMPVAVVKTPEELSELAVEFGGCATFVVPAGLPSTGPVQLLQRRPTRFKAVISIDTLGTSTQVWLAHRPDYLSGASPQGFLIAAAPKIFQWENQQPCWCLVVGGTVVNVSVIDQAQAATQSQSEEVIQAGDLTIEGQTESGNVEPDAGNYY